MPGSSSSFPRKWQSRHFKGFWIPALRFAPAGMTVLHAESFFSTLSRERRRLVTIGTAWSAGYGLAVRRRLGHDLGHLKR